MDVVAIQKQLREIAMQLQALSDSLAVEDAAFPPNLLEKLSSRICLVCGLVIEKDEAPLRGNHRRCDMKITRRIAAGELTDVAAVAAGLRAPKALGGRPRNRELDERIAAAAKIAIPNSSSRINYKKPESTFGKVAEEKQTKKRGKIEE